MSNGWVLTIVSQWYVPVYISLVKFCMLVYCIITVICTLYVFLLVVKCFEFQKAVCWAVQWSWFARVNALCNLSCKRSQRHVRPDFWVPVRFTLCITVEVEPRIVKQYKCHHCCSCKNYWGKGMEGGRKVSALFFGWSEIASLWKRCVSGHPIARATAYCLLPNTFWLQASKNVFKVGSVKFANSLSPPSTVKKVCTRNKSSEGT